jgi:pyruvate/2-oxoglutarate dehydrogenase complex dihydrolipoamide dehydrogenase (E3) component
VVRQNTVIHNVEMDGDDIAVTFEADELRETLVGTHLLVAAGRAANVEELDLAKARVKADRRGILINKRLRTSNRRIYAIGDVAHGYQFTHTAGYQAGLVVRNAVFGLPAKQNNDIIPWVTFTDPEIANVGLNEQMARERKIKNFKVVRWSFSEIDRARTDGQTEGMVKMIVGKKGKILGCGIVGAQAGELIALFSFAIANNLDTSSLIKFIAPYPTLSDIARRVGVESYRETLSNPWIGRWVRLIRLLP